MQVRKQHMVPEVHFGPSVPGVVMTRPPADTETRAYVAKLLSKLPVQDQHFLVPYESFQPPLYYLTAGLITQLVPPDPQKVLYVGRLLAVVLGRRDRLFLLVGDTRARPTSPMWAIASAGVVALLPSFCFANAHASNDCMINLSATAAFYVWIRGLRHPAFDQRLLLAGVMLGLALPSKLTAVALIPGLGLVILFRMFQVRPAPRV